MKLNAAGLGIRIKQARTAKGWTQTELAKALGVQRSSVVRWETGVSVARKIPHISKVLGQTAEWFLERADEGTFLTVPKDNQEMKQLRGEVRRLQKELRSTLTERTQHVNHADVEARVERAIRNERARTDSAIEPKSVTVNIINEKAQVTEKHTITERQTVQNTLRHTVQNTLRHTVENTLKNVVENVEAADVKARVAKFHNEEHRDGAILADILKSWNTVSEEARLMAALLITGDWSYKLKLWNRNIAVGDDVLKSVRPKKKRFSSRTA